MKYTIFSFSCSSCSETWDTICKSDLYCPKCKSQGHIVYQQQIDDEKNDVQTTQNVI